MVMKQMTTTTTETKGDELPFSLIAAEILSRLPAKSDIGRCRCVCKEWNSFLSTPTFIRTHLQRHVTITDYKLLLFDSHPLLPFCRLPLNQTVPCNPNPNPKPAVSILATLDGLVCLVSTAVHPTLLFLNPLTGAYKRLSTIPGFDFLFFIATDPIGFYMDDSDNDYKLICLICGGRRGAYVYSHRLDSWREIEFSVVHPVDFCKWSPATFCGQCVYFVVTCLIPPANNNIVEYYTWIICFDVKTETFRIIRVPPPTANGATNYYSSSLVVLDGCLHLCVSYKMIFNIGNVKDGGDLWRLDDGDEWVKVAAFIGDCPVKRICTATTGNWLAVLDQDDNSFVKMNTEEFTAHYHSFCDASTEYISSRMIYVETLVSPIL